MMTAESFCLRGGLFNLHNGLCLSAMRKIRAPIFYIYQKIKSEICLFFKPLLRNIYCIYFDFREFLLVEIAPTFQKSVDSKLFLIIPAGPFRHETTLKRPARIVKAPAAFQPPPVTGTLSKTGPISCYQKLVSDWFREAPDFRRPLNRINPTRIPAGDQCDDLVSIVRRAEIISHPTV